MIKLNDSNLIVGEIKQLLKNFNLPNCYIGDGTNVPDGKLFITPNGYSLLRKGYLNGDKVVKTEVVRNYVFNEQYLNLTTNFKIENVLYDRYTHRYLGRYLRFLRDYSGIDLMCMYNCFDQQPYEQELKIQYTDDSYSIFGEINKDYITYIIPFDKQSLRKFSVYLQSTLPIETCLIVKNNIEYSFGSEKWRYLGDQYIDGTYKRFAIAKSNLLDYSEVDIKDYLDNNLTIALLIKLPKTIRSSVVFLEGDYISNKLIVDGRRGGIYDVYSWNYNVNPQLASYTNDSNYLLSDKIIQYLTGNAITPLSDDYDIKKLQNYLFTNYSSYNEYNYAEELYNGVLGKWSKVDFDVIKQIIQEKIFSFYDNKTKQLKEYYDRLPFIDCDVEKIIHDSINEYEHKKIYGDN